MICRASGTISLATMRRAPDAKLVHYTQGMPVFEEQAAVSTPQHWLAEHQASNKTLGWVKLMGHYVHARSDPRGPQGCQTASSIRDPLIAREVQRSVFREDQDIGRAGIH